MEKDESIKIAALGRPFCLGMLYDRRRDELVPGEKLWDPDQLSDSISSRPQPASDYEVIADDSFGEKASSLDIEASLKLSFLGGLINVGGSAKYLDDRKSSSRQSRVSLKYRCTTVFKELTMKQLGRGKIVHPEIFEQNIATHVVVGVLYGCQAVFVFDKEVSESEDERKIHGELQVMVKALPGITSIEGEGKLDMNETEKKKTDKLSCKFYGDICLPRNPTTYEEAVKNYQELPSYVGENGENAVPVAVWLFPLSKLDNKGQQLVREISHQIMNQLEETLEGFEKVKVHCNDLLLKNTCKYIPEVRARIVQFKDAVNTYHNSFRRNMTEILPRVRGYGAEEIELSKLLELQMSSPFSLGRLQSWLSDRKQEMTVLEAYVNALKMVTIAENAGDVAAESFKHDYLVVLHIMLPLLKDDFLQDMKDNIRSQGHSLSANSDSTKHWFKNKAVQQAMRTTLKAFTMFVDDNKDCSDVEFLVTIAEDESTDEKTCAQITFYENGIPVHENFIPPGPPGKPIMLKADTDSITIQWPPPTVGEECVDHYDISYRKNQDDDWSNTSTESKTNVHVIGNLYSKYNYEFRVRAACLKGTCRFGHLSDEFSTSTTLARDILSTSKLVKKGQPGTYKLPLLVHSQNPSARTRKCVFGKAKMSGDAMTEKTIMLVGATGSGKSTLIDGFINYILNVDWDDDFRFSLVDMLPEEAAKTNEATSRTEWITSYKINHVEGNNINYTLNIIDTPGFGDTRGIKRDKEITEQVRQLFTDKGNGGITFIDAICFVTQAPLSRLTPSQKYIYSSILSIFGSDIIENITVLITFADGKTPPVLDALKAAEVPFRKGFRFNNSALFEPNRQAGDKFSQLFWQMGVDSFKVFFDELGKMKTKSLVLTKEVLNERNALELIIGNLQPKIDVGLSQVNALRKEQVELEKHADDIANNRDFEYEVDEVKVEQVKIPGKQPSTFCVICNNECHEVCAYADNSDKKNCCAMDGNGYCTECTGKCFWQDHINAPWRLQAVTKKITKIYDGKKEKMEQAQGKHKEKLGIIATVRQGLRDIENAVTSMISTMTQKITRLGAIALRPNPLNVVDYIDQMIENENMEKKPGYDVRITELKKQRNKTELMDKAQRGELQTKFT